MCSPDVPVRDRVLAELASLGPGTADALALLGEIRDLARFIDRAQGELARLTGALDAAGGAAEAGYSSTVAFLRHGCGRSPGRAGELVATGRALRRLEATGTALTAGEISFDSAHAICRAAGQLGDGAAAAAVEEQLLAFARPQPPPAAAQDPAGPDAAPAAAPGLDPAQLRRLGEELVYRADPWRGGRTPAEAVRAPAPVARVHLRPLRRDLRDVRGRGIAGDHPHRGRRVRPARRDRGHPHRRAAADGRPDRRLPGRPGLRHRRHPARRRPAPEHPGRRADPRRRSGRGTGADRLRGPAHRPPGPRAGLPRRPRPSSAGGTASRWMSAAATGPRPPRSAARWKPATRAAAPPAAACRPPGAPPTT